MCGVWCTPRPGCQCGPEHPHRRAQVQGREPREYPGSGERASVSGNEPNARSRPSSQTSPSMRDRIRRDHASGMNTGQFHAAHQADLFEAQQ